MRSLLAKARANARIHLEAGVTTVRECGGRGDLMIQLSGEIDAGNLRLPRILASGAPLAVGARASLVHGRGSPKHRGDRAGNPRAGRSRSLFHQDHQHRRRLYAGDRPDRSVVFGRRDAGGGEYGAFAWSARRFSRSWRAGHSKQRRGRRGHNRTLHLGVAFRLDNRARRAARALRNPNPG